MFGTAKRLHLADFERIEAQLRGGCGGSSLVARIAPAAPDDKGAADGEQRRRVLDDDRQRREGAGCDHIKRAQPLGPGLRTRMDDACVLRRAG